MPKPQSHEHSHPLMRARLCGLDLELGKEELAKIVRALARRGYLAYIPERECFDYYANSEESRLVYKILVLYVLGYRDLEIDGYTVTEWLIHFLNRVDPRLVSLLYA